jgi:hypothetical protein
MSSPRHIGFILEEFSPGSPAQQLLDRFLLGYHRAGQFHRPEMDVAVALLNAHSADLLQARVRDHGLQFTSLGPRLFRDLDSVVFVSNSITGFPNSIALQSALLTMKPGTRCFVYGLPASDPVEARKLVAAAAARKLMFCSGTVAACPFQLPELKTPAQSHVSEALLLSQGMFPRAELTGLEALLPFVENRQAADTQLQSIEFLEGTKVWEAGYAGKWSRLLLSSAFSRSNNLKGDSERDGRTQDIAGLGLVESLAKTPRAMVLKYADGFSAAILVLDGAIGDSNLALRYPDGRILSTQLYHPPAPMNDSFSTLASLMEDFFQTGEPPWPQERSILLSEALSRIPAATPGAKG